MKKKGIVDDLLVVRGDNGMLASTSQTRRCVLAVVVVVVYILICVFTCLIRSIETHLSSWGDTLDTSMSRHLENSKFHE